MNAGRNTNKVLRVERDYYTYIMEAFKRGLSPSPTFLTKFYNPHQPAQTLTRYEMVNYLFNMVYKQCHTIKPDNTPTPQHKVYKRNSRHIAFGDPHRLV